MSIACLVQGGMVKQTPATSETPYGDRYTYTDEQVTRAAGLHLDNLRKLITWGAVKPVQAGGGRGKTRLWEGWQALRISITSQIANSGFSLQMAHTLCSCLPVSDLVQAYDPDIIRWRAKFRAERGEKRLRAMIAPAGTGYWPRARYSDGEIAIIDSRFVYYAPYDPWGEDGRHSFAGVIDHDRNRFLPFYGVGPAVDVPSTNLPKRIRDNAVVSRSSLLVDDEYLTIDEKARTRRIQNLLPAGLSFELPAKFLYSTLVAVNLEVGLTMFIRKLLELPIENPLTVSLE